MPRFLAVLLFAMLVVLGMGQDASAIVIDFDSQGLSGPSTFAAVIVSPQTLNIPTAIGNVTFQNGVILTNTTNLPANATSIYGTASFGFGLSNPLVVTFPTPISNFFLDVLNGLTVDVTYQVSDNAGHSATFDLAPNLSSGQTQIGFAASGDIITITALASGGGPATTWDFFIDNIHFNEPLPGELNPVPEPATLLLLGTSVAGLGLARWRRSRQS